MHTGCVELIRHTRGPLVEVVHHGMVAVAGLGGQLLAAAGDAQAPVFTRSTLKPFQALPFILADGPQRAGFTAPQIALLCASHSGEDMHVREVDRMLQVAGVGVQKLRCGCHVPLRFTHTGQPMVPGLHYDARHNNCSGKHAGFLVHCKQQRLDLDSYLEPDHPLQRDIRRVVAHLAGIEPKALIAGMDGCSAPNYAMPLQTLATFFARLAAGRAAPEFGVALEILRDAMRDHPEMVSGTGRSDLAFTRAGRGDWITKIGADGVQVLASLKRQQAIAVKVISGHMPAVYATLVVALDHLGWLDAAQREELAPWGPAALVNASGKVVGETRAAFRF